jgi:Tfp pilus assembly protein PilO
VKRSEQILLVGVLAVGMLVAFWLVIMSPKRSEATKLQDEVDQLQSSLTEAQQQVTAGLEARQSFGVDYRRLVVLGKAVPADSEQSSLLIQLQALADRSGVEFQSMDLSDASGSATAAAPPTPTTSTSTDSSTSTSTETSTTSTSTSTSDSSTGAATTALATEASASTLPLGASVGPAGLPVMPYDLSFTGGFFQIADFMEQLDGMVHMNSGLVDVRGRLLTVNGFTLTPADTGPVAEPELTADLNVTTFLAPADQGITAGATPTGPSPVTPTLTSSTTSGTTSSTTATPSSTSSVPTDSTATTTP